MSHKPDSKPFDEKSTSSRAVDTGETVPEQAARIVNIIVQGGVSGTIIVGDRNQINSSTRSDRKNDFDSPGDAAVAATPAYTDYERLYLLKEMLRDSTDIRAVLSHLIEREPSGEGQIHRSIIEKLLEVMRNEQRPLTERVRAGDILAQLGDPRFQANAWFLPNDDMLGFVEIPAGPFYMGNDFADSKQHRCQLPTFYINRFSVTVAQYNMFLESQKEPRRSIDKTGSLSNHPITNITWFDAMRYCEWLTKMLQNWPDATNPVASLLQSGKGGDAWVVSLPSEAEWEKSARGINDSRIYPWGSLEAAPNFANYKETKLNKTCSVGCFEGGKSPFDIYDLSGNIWEWTRSHWGADMATPTYRYPYNPFDGRESPKMPDNVLKVMRGGSYFTSPNEIQCSSRSAALPKSAAEHIGFRLAIIMHGTRA